jgi:CRISPR-associated protein Csm2
MYDRGAVQLTTLNQIVVDGNAAVLVKQAEPFAEYLQTTGLTKSQIRGVFGTVRQIQAGWEKNEPQQNLRKVLLLKPRLSYQKARQSKVGPLADVLSAAIDLVAQAQTSDEQRKRFGYFVDLFEAILAYHTAAGGR